MSKNIATALRASLVFSGLDDAQLAALAGLATERHLASGEYLFWEGDAPDSLYIITAGRIKAVKHSSTGKEFIVAFLGIGEILGEVAVFQNLPYPASAEAAKATTVLAIRREGFLKFLESNPEVSMRIISVLGARLREAQERLKDIASERVEQRLARMLLMLADRLGATLPFTRQEIADMAGTTTETTIRVMGRLKEAGAINSVRGNVVIKDRTKLELVAEGPPRI